MTSNLEVDPPSRLSPPQLDDYDAVRASFSVVAPERFNAVIDILDSWADEAPLDPALLCIDADSDEAITLSIADLVAKSQQSARALLSLGIVKGDRILIMLPRSADWYYAMLGAIRIGAVPMPAPNLLAPPDIQYRLATGKAIAAITDTSGAAKIGQSSDLPAGFLRLCLPNAQTPPSGWIDLDHLMTECGDGQLPIAPTGRDDPLMIFFTSGTVGYPKMVVHAQSYALGHIATARFWQDLRKGDRHWTVSDTGWAKAAWGSLFGQWHERATVVQVALNKPEPARIFSILGRFGITSFCAPPTLYRTLVAAPMNPDDFATLRHCTSAGEPLNPEVIRLWREGTGGLVVYEGYGQTETTVVVANFRTVRVRPGSMGLPVPGFEVDICDEKGKRLPQGEIGDISVRADPHPIGLFKGYGGDVPDRAGRFVNGWYRTGDRGRRDEQGYFWFEARDDDVITSSAYRIGPFEVESALVSHPAIVEAGVVGRPDQQRTEIVCAFVILHAGIEPTGVLAEQIQSHVKSVTAPYKYPREIIFVRELPKTVSGKIRRNELRLWLRTGLPEGVLQSTAAVNE